MAPRGSGRALAAAATAAAVGPAAGFLGTPAAPMPLPAPRGRSMVGPAADASRPAPQAGAGAGGALRRAPAGPGRRRGGPTGIAMGAAAGAAAAGTFGLGLCAKRTRRPRACGGGPSAADARGQAIAGNAPRTRSTALNVVGVNPGGDQATDEDTYVGRFDGSEARHASPAMAAASQGAGAADTDVASLPTSAKWSVLSSRVEGLVAELSQVVGKQDAYCISQSTGEGPAMKAVREKMLATPWAEEWSAGRTMFSYGEEMSTDPLEALLLKQLAHLAGARKILEVGMFVGYGSVAMLEGAPEAELVSLEIDPYLKGWLAECLSDMPTLANRHRVVLGPALDSFPTLKGEQFNLVFVDANKAEYRRYVELILEHDLLAPGGTIVADNVLYNGYPYVDRHFDAQPQRRGFGDAVQEFNAWVRDHPALEQVVLPIRDGVSLIRRRPASA